MCIATNVFASCVHNYVGEAIRSWISLDLILIIRTSIRILTVSAAIVTERQQLVEALKGLVEEVSGEMTAERIGARAAVKQCSSPAPLLCRRLRLHPLRLLLPARRERQHLRYH